jgi:ribosome-binding factor A
MSRRIARVAEAVREAVSTAILFEVKDPRVTGVTVLRAEVAGDLRHAKVFVSLMGDERTQRLALFGLKSARGFLQRKIAERLQTRFTPVIDIVVDESVKKSLEMSRLLKELLPEAPPEASVEDED